MGLSIILTTLLTTLTPDLCADVYTDENGVPYQRRTAYTYATTGDGAERLREELIAATTAGRLMAYIGPVSGLE